MINLAPEQAAFIQAIAAAPDDDLPRLVYADWLDEHGASDRAEYIRVQVALSKPTLGADGTGDSGERYKLVRRELAVERSTDPEMWSLYHQACWPPSRFVFRRGFLDEVHCETGDWIGEPCQNCLEGFADPETGVVECGRCDCTGEIGRTGPTILSDFPTVTRVELIDKEPYWNGGAFSWYSDGRVDPVRTVPTTAELPERLFLLLPDEPSMYAGTRWKGWSTQKAANDALSAACIRFAREED